MAKDFFAAEDTRPTIKQSHALVASGLLGALMLVVIALVFSHGSAVGDTYNSYNDSALHTEVSALIMRVEALEQSNALKSALNETLRAEVALLTQSNGVLERLTGHVRRLDGEGKALRLELAELFQGAVASAAFDPLAIEEEEAAATVALAERPSSGMARHQLVTRAAGSPPSVTPRMSDTPLPPERMPETGSEAGEADTN